MKTAILTAFNERYAAIADITLPIMTAYCNRHGYGLKVGLYREDPTNLRDWGDRGKIDLFNQHYATHDILVWLDIDVLVMNRAVTVEGVLGDRPFLWTYDVNGPCSGFWIARCIPPVKLFLDAVAQRAQRGGAVTAREELGPPHSVTLQLEPRGTSDQTTMTALMNVPPFWHVAKHIVEGKSAGHCYDYRELNWPREYDYLGHYAPGGWLLTFPSAPLDRRIELLKEWAGKAA